ncbi:WYL domain-containing protein [Dongshaea marina]|uniref:WYL domain-containing protein n=1 Tax=Dongshaea marina TaxID=2047966 RepID=UPI000D3EDD43|nr:WYL domain-containing protein [Dongshaea marina]
MAKKNPKSLDDLSAPQRERLWLIDFLAQFKGELTRNDVVKRFGVTLSNATIDLALYRKLAPENIHYDARSKTYQRTQSFVPLFDYEPLKTLSTLSEGVSEGFHSGPTPVSISPSHHLNQPDLEILASVCRAIHFRQALRASYISLTSGETERELVPHSLVDTGQRWHVRAYCRKRQEFRDFVLTRFTQICSEGLTIDSEQESVECDNDWNAKVTLTLIPHPGVSFPEAIERDYGMQNGTLEVTGLPAATIGYLLRLWSVDCSADHRLSAAEYQLALANPADLHSAGNFAIAPGAQLS